MCTHRHGTAPLRCSWGGWTCEKNIVPQTLPLFFANIPIYSLAGTWRVVKVDDQVPLDADGKPLLPVFMGPNREIWLFLLLKAALKCCSSHIGVLYNDEQAVLGLLTGFQVRAMPVSPTHRLELKRRLLSWMHHKDQTFLLLSCRGPTVDESEVCMLPFDSLPPERHSYPSPVSLSYLPFYIVCIAVGTGNCWLVTGAGTWPVGTFSCVGGAACSGNSLGTCCLSKFEVCRMCECEFVNF